MKVLSLLALLCLTLPLGASASPSAKRAPSEADGGLSTKGFHHPARIFSDNLSIRGRRHQAVWSGHVKVLSGTTQLTCDRLITDYADQSKITHMTCLGHVVVVDGDKWAKGERADFDDIHGVLVVTGHPEARQGTNRIRGDQVTFYVGRDLLRVKNVQAVFETKKGSPILPSGAEHPKPTKPGKRTGGR